jgi:2-hydroxycyclohexanecarboxyl-CoA dehydrogenase
MARAASGMPLPASGKPIAHGRPFAMLARLQTFSLLGIDAVPVDVEVDVIDRLYSDRVLALPAAAAAPVNAGLVLRQRFTDTTQQDWDAQIGVGLFGVLNTCHAALPYMEKNKFGRIISLAGDSARVGESGLAVTAAARGGVLAFTKSIAKEFGRFNVTANAVTLGLIATAHTDPVWLETNREKIVRQYPLRRIGESEDVAPMVLFLASKQASWITGQVVSVNGGFAMV